MTQDNPVRLRDVARVAGVSQGTASNVFNRPEIVRQEVRERVEAAAKELGYAGPSLTGRLLRAGKINAIGVATAEPLTYFFEDQWARTMMAAIAAECDKQGAGLSIVSAMNRGRPAWNIQSALVDGLILLCAEEGPALIGQTEKRELPFVALGLEESTIDAPGVGIDNRDGARQAAEHLVALGHRRIAILGIGESWNALWPTPEEVLATPYLTVRDRAEGYWAGLATAGIAAADVPYADTDAERETVWAAMSRLFAAERPPTGVLAMSDRVALFAIEWLKGNGRRVPEDVSVVGFDGIPEGADTLPALTTVQQPFQELAARAVGAILGGEEIAARTVLPLPLVVRGSTGPAPKSEL
ncbi:LacI family DNA-binding transcriptional regulator [Devosia sp.]|uniref:LacI family DNA-binding transcriptional regulator n=1 Tax=Devosia sp. TaxID=1871048 RepID=UPI0025FB9EB7|nr:LacI family DNA-binding transcriptional regulator [Devosia sp.]MCR6635089.1 LacI family transcriptional regulator [Devosia sp.]